MTVLIGLFALFMLFCAFNVGFSDFVRVRYLSLSLSISVSHF
jgi:hypothetical protein